MSYYIFFNETPTWHKPGKFAIRYHWKGFGQEKRWAVTELHDKMYGSAQLGLKKPEAEWFNGEAWVPIADGYWDARRQEHGHNQR